MSDFEDLDEKEYDEVILARNSKTFEFLVQCGRCRGTGTNEIDPICRVCNGKGSVKFIMHKRGRDSFILKCIRCQGTGKNEHESFCQVCNGVGASPFWIPRYKCPRCNGTGKTPTQPYCLTCGGTGGIFDNENVMTVHRKWK